MVDETLTDDAGVRSVTVLGNDWHELSGLDDGDVGDQIVVNMGPQHPSTHGVLRLILTLDGETVTETRLGIGYLHTGIEKSMEYRTWTQGVTFCTRMDYLASIAYETSYCLGIERMLRIEEEVPERAQVLRVMMNEFQRIASHLVAVATFGLEIGALTVMTNGFREREMVLDIMEMVTGVRMNYGFIRPGGVAQDLPPGAVDKVREFCDEMPKRIRDMRAMMDDNPVFVARTRDVAYLDASGCLALGVTGPVLRSAGLPWDLRKMEPYCGYENYDFEVATETGCDAYARYLVRMTEMEESVKIIAQCLERLRPGPVMVADKKIAWPAQLSIGADGMGNSLDHIRTIMGTSMEALIHHFKLVTEGFRVPAGQAYAVVESPRGELGCHVVSDGGTRPYRVHFRDPSFVNLQALPAMCEGGQLADVITAVATLDPLMGGVDR